MTEREQFEAWWEAERQRRWVENGMADRKGPTASAHWCAGLEHDHWRGWQARAALAQPVAADAEDAAKWREHVGKLDALVAFCPTCCEGKTAAADMTRDEVIFQCGRTSGKSEAARAARPTPA